MIRNPALHEKRNREVLADVVRTYIETGEPVSSRSISRRHAEPLSPATIRNIMADLEEAGFLYQPHTSAGRVPTADAYRFFVQSIAGQATLEEEDRDWIHRELSAANTPEEVMERASHVLAAVSRGMGIVVAPPLASTVLEHVRFILLPDGRVLVVLVSPGSLTRDKVIRCDRSFTQAELDSTSDYLNHHFAHWTLDAIRTELLSLLARDRAHYDRLVGAALVLCDPGVLEQKESRHVYLEGAGQVATTAEFSDESQLRELIDAIEQKNRLVTLLTSAIETPEPVNVQIGLKQMSAAGDNLALITSQYGPADQMQGTLGVLGPLRMHYERAITVVAHVARLISDPTSDPASDSTPGHIGPKTSRPS